MPPLDVESAMRRCQGTSLPGLKAPGQHCRLNQNLEWCACLQGLRLIDLYTKKGVDPKRIYIKVMPRASCLLARAFTLRLVSCFDVLESCSFPLGHPL